MVNRIWQYHFGRGIVRSSNNFGQIGDPPTHPELLDWLAAEFVRGGWRLKPLHRIDHALERLSHVVRRQAPTAWPKTPRTISSGGSTCGGSAPRRSATRSTPSPASSTRRCTARACTRRSPPRCWPASRCPAPGGASRSQEEQARRSIYIHVKRSLITPILADFDFPETDSSCAGRFATVQPAQALGMLNGKFLHDQAEAFAARLRREAGDDRRAQIKRALRLAVLRDQRSGEIERGLSLIAIAQRKTHAQRRRGAEVLLSVGLNLNEFVYLD